LTDILAAGRPVVVSRTWQVIGCLAGAAIFEVGYRFDEVVFENEVGFGSGGIDQYKSALRGSGRVLE
jgi:hypothetical protein